MLSVMLCSESCGSALGLGIDSDVPIRFSIFLITFSEYSFNTKAIDISKKMNSKHQFTNGELIKRN